MTYDTITEKQKQVELVKNILSREQEIHNYQINIDNFNSMISVMTMEWTDDLLPYKLFDRDRIAREVPLEKMDLVSDLVYKDLLVHNLRTSMIEQRNVQRVHDALTQQISVEDFQTIVAELEAGTIV